MFALKLHVQRMINRIEILTIMSLSGPFLTVAFHTLIQAFRTVCFSYFILRKKGIEIADPILSGPGTLINIVDKLNEPVNGDFVHGVFHATGIFICLVFIQKKYTL